MIFLFMFFVRGGGGDVVSCVCHVICVHMRSYVGIIVWFLSTWRSEYLRLRFVSFCQSVHVVQLILQERFVLLSCASCHDITGITVEFCQWEEVR